MNNYSTWQCIKTLIMDDGFTVAFTEHKFYTGEPSATPGGEWAMSFLDDTDTEHLMPSKWLHEYFVKVQ